MKIHRKVSHALFFISFPLCAQADEWQQIGSQGSMHFVSVSEASQADPDLYLSAISRLCKKKERFCKILFFVNVDAVQFPLSDEDVRAQVADYTKNTATGFDRLLMACRVLDDPSSRDCFSND